MTFSRSLALLSSCWGYRPGWKLGQALPTSSRRPCGPIVLARTSQWSVLRLFYFLHMPLDIPTRKDTDNLLENSFTAVCDCVFLHIYSLKMTQLCLNRERESWEDTQADKRRTLPADHHHTGTRPFNFCCFCFFRHAGYFKDQLYVCLEKRLRADLSRDTRQQSQTGRRQSKSPHSLHVSLRISGVPATIFFPTSSAVFSGYKWWRYVAVPPFASALQLTGILRQLHCKRNRWMIIFPNLERCFFITPCPLVSLLSHHI